MLDKLLREPVARAVLPAARAVNRAGVSANVITVTGTLIVATGALLVAGGNRAVGGWVLSGGVIFDAFDGILAKAAGGGGPKGAFLDSTTDRVSDGLVFSALAWSFAGADGLGLALSLAAGLLAFLTSYIRARAEGLGIDAKGGLVERPERMILVIGGLVFGVVIPALVILVALSLVTVVQRFAIVWGRAGASAGP